MSCKYSSAMLLLLGSLSLTCSPADSNGVYATYDNFAYLRWSSNQPISFGTRSAATPDDGDVQRVIANRAPPANTPRGSVRPAAAPASAENIQHVQPSRVAPANNHRGSVRPVAASAPAPAADSGASYASVANSGPASDPARVPALVSPPGQRQTPPVTTVLRNDAAVQAAPWPSATSGPTRPPPVFSFRERFSSTLFQPISRSNPQRNVVYSPFSVHATLSMIYGVSEGQTALELQRAGQFNADKLGVALDFQKVLQRQRASGVQFTVASKWYYDYQLSEINPDYKRYAKELYDSDVEGVDMKRAATTAARINDWASEATRGIIRELVTPNDIGDNTETLLVNAIYFKARWATEFSAMDTTPEKFRLSNNEAITVPMMFNDEVFPYAELPDLDAKALELPYAGIDASMLLILPNRVDGLPQLERQLGNGNLDLNVVASRLRRDTVTVRLPKFRVEFEQDMTNALQQLGVRRMFTKDSEVVAMLLRPVQVSKILQKAFIDVNEAGSEAAAASYAKFVPLSLPMQSREFTADHPFLFAIRTPDTVLFIGHVVQPTQ